MKRILILSIVILFPALTFAQTGIRIMHYNLLYYGNPSWLQSCNDNNNNMTDKDGYLATILDHIQPDIVTINEMLSSSTVGNALLNGAFNINGASHWRRASTTASSNDIGNMIFYDERKFTLYDTDVINTSPRITDVYKFYYNSPDLEILNDTLRFFCIVAHLKAGTDQEANRATATSLIMQTVQSWNQAGNYLFMGDLNTYGHTEQCYQNLINPSNSTYDFNDPVNKPGSWHTNPSFQAYHTQSSHTSSTGCAVTGGLDDRFDFILASNYIMNGTDKVTYITDSYTTVGQDGNHYNDAINYGANNSAPGEVIQALYDMSDHLPVVLDLEIDQTPVASLAEKDDFDDISLLYKNPANENLELDIVKKSYGQVKLELVSIIGQLLYEDDVECQRGHNKLEVPINKLVTGVYFIRATTDGSNVVRKFVKP